MLQQQREILIQFYRVTSGDRWVHKYNWDDENQPVNSFSGVTVDATTGTVIIGIKLPWNKLSGTADTFTVFVIYPCTYCMYLKCVNLFLKTLEIHACFNTYIHFVYK
jgi:hypothetical protein